MTIKNYTATRFGYKFNRPDKAVFIANELGRLVDDPPPLYKQRWHIELISKWTRQNQKIKQFIWLSQNAVIIQLLIAMTAYLLLRTSQLVSVSLTRHRSILAMLNPSSPIPSIRLPAKSVCLLIASSLNRAAVKSSH